MELYQAFGMKYEILGKTTLPLQPLLSTDHNDEDTYHERITIKGHIDSLQCMSYIHVHLNLLFHTVTILVHVASQYSTCSVHSL